MVSYSGREKEAVVFDIGYAYTKCGYAGEPHPRSIIPSQVVKWDAVKKKIHCSSVWQHQKESDFDEALVDFFHQLYYKELLVTPKDRRVVIVESVLCPSRIRDRIAHVLFEKYAVPSILFAPTHLLTLFTLGIQSGLVLDVGYKEAVVMPIFEGHLILSSWQNAPLGGEAVHRRLKELLQECATLKSLQGETKSWNDYPGVLTDDVLEDIKVRTCFVAPMSRADAYLQWELSEKTDESMALLPPTPKATFEYPLPVVETPQASPVERLILEVPYRVRELSPEVLFGMDNDHVCLATLLLDALLRVPLDMRTKLAENIVVVGGTAQLPGLKARLKDELLRLVKSDLYADRLSLNCFKFHSPPAKENYAAWLGGAMFGSLEALTVRSLTRETYLQRGGVPDWTDMFDDSARVGGRERLGGRE